MVQHHADSPLTNLQCNLVRRLAFRRPFLSGVTVSGNTGAVQLPDADNIIGLTKRGVSTFRL